MTDYEAVIEILKAESSITDKVAVMVNQDGTTSTEKTIMFGTLPEAQDVYPAISLRRGTKDKLNGVEDGFLVCDCWAKTMTESTVLAEAVDELFTDSFAFASGSAFKTSSDIITTVDDGVVPNTPVNIRLIRVRR